MITGLHALHTLPWTSDPDTYIDAEGLTLTARIAEGAVAILHRLQCDSLGDSYDEDMDGLWQAIMDGSIETRKECLHWIRSRCHGPLPA